MSTRLGKVVKKGSRPMNVTRRGLTTFVNSRPVTGGEVVASVRLWFQRVGSRPVVLQRLPDGDQTMGDTRIWVEVENLAAAEDITVPGVPLGWTELQTAPPERADGPPGDFVDYKGRRYEITERLGWTETGTFTNAFAGFQRYEFQERGATP